MAEPDTIPVSASIATTGKGIRYTQNWIYAYSGVVDVGAAGEDVDTLLLEFTTGNSVLKATVQFFYGEVNTSDFMYKVFMNELVVVQYVVAETLRQPDTAISLIIPPHTTIKAMAANLSNATPLEQSVIITGRVYGAE